MKKLLLFTSWLPCTLFLLFFTIQLYNSTNSLLQVKDINRLTNMKLRELTPKNAYQMYAALPQNVEIFQTVLAKKDARPEIIKSYLKGSPLADYADAIVLMGDFYSINPYLVIAIGECESNNGRKIPADSFNAWGLGIPTGAKTGLGFSNWEEGLNTEFKFLKKLIDRGLTTPETMGPIYAPPSAQNGDSWANCVNHFLDNLK